MGKRVPRRLEPSDRRGRRVKGRVALGLARPRHLPRNQGSGRGPAQHSAAQASGSCVWRRWWLRKRGDGEEGAVTQEGWALVGTLGEVLACTVHYSGFREARAAACLLTWGMGSPPPVLFRPSTSVLCSDPAPGAARSTSCHGAAPARRWLRPFGGARRCPTAGGAVCGQRAECHLTPVLNSELQIVQHS